MSPTETDTAPPAHVRFRLLSSLSAAEFAGATYFYDASVRFAPLLFVPMQRVKRPYFEVVSSLRSANPANHWWSIERIQVLFPDATRRRALELLVRRGYLESDASAGKDGSDPDRLMRDFLDREERHYFYRPRVFNLPAEIDDEAVQVGFVGVPFASSTTSSGTVSGPTALRALTSRAGVWFDVYEQGVYGEVGVEGSLPEVLCRGVVLRDDGDLGQAVRTPADLFAQVRAFVDARVGRSVPMIYAGGDHAITFPIVDAYLRHFPELALVHLDAHNDLFYIDDVRYSHAAPISNLLRATGLSGVFSLGLRTVGGARVGQLTRLASEPGSAARAHLYSIGALKRMLSDPTRLDAFVESVGPGRPCYLSIDLDVLSSSAVAGRVSTPAGPGLEWWELIETVRVLARRLRLVACDIVELDALAKGGGNDFGAEPASFLFQLVHGLAAQRSRTFGR